MAAYRQTGYLPLDQGLGESSNWAIDIELQSDGTLHVIHVKAAHSSSSGRRIAVTSFEQLVSQAEKNIRRLEAENLHAELLVPRTSRPACWVRGRRVDSRTAFLTRLERRGRQDRTYVVLVQPHLTGTAYGRARTAIDVDAPDSNARSLNLLDNLLHSTRRTISSRCDDLIVIGST